MWGRLSRLVHSSVRYDAIVAYKLREKIGTTNSGFLFLAFTLSLGQGKHSSECLGILNDFKQSSRSSLLQHTFCNVGHTFVSSFSGPFQLPLSVSMLGSRFGPLSDKLQHKYNEPLMWSVVSSARIIHIKRPPGLCFENVDFGANAQLACEF